MWPPAKCPPKPSRACRNNSFNCCPLGFRTACKRLKQLPAQGRVVLRRLNRTEYQNSVRDLLGVQADLTQQLPQDGAANGFDNAGAALHTSSFLMERYLEAADTALNLAIVNRKEPPKRIDQRVSIKDGHPVRNSSERVYRFLDDGEVVCFCSSLWHNVHVPAFYPTEGGNYRFRISTSSFQSAGKPVTYRVTVGGSRLTGTSGLVGYYDAPADQHSVVEITRYMEPRTTLAIIPWGLAGAQAVNKVGQEAWEGPGLAIQYVEFEGPLYDAWPPESHRRIFGDLEQKPRRPTTKTRASKWFRAIRRLTPSGSCASSSAAHFAAP